METKPLLYAIVGFILGGLLVSIVATTQNESKDKPTQTVLTTQHNMAAAEELEELKGDAFDEVFVKEMISHHQGAVQMAKLIDKNAKHNELKQLGQDIIAAQTSEISIMKAWQTEWGYESTSVQHGAQNMHGR